MVIPDSLTIPRVASIHFPVGLDPHCHGFDQGSRVCGPCPVHSAPPTRKYSVTLSVFRIEQIYPRESWPPGRGKSVRFHWNHHDRTHFRTLPTPGPPAPPGGLHSAASRCGRTVGAPGRSAESAGGRRDLARNLVSGGPSFHGDRGKHPGLEAGRATSGGRAGRRRRRTSGVSGGSGVRHGGRMGVSAGGPPGRPLPPRVRPEPGRGAAGSPHCAVAGLGGGSPPRRHGSGDARQFPATRHPSVPPGG